VTTDILCRRTWKLGCLKKGPKKREYAQFVRRPTRKSLVSHNCRQSVEEALDDNVMFFNIHSAFLDELIRQCTVESPERGLLLLRVRDEMRIIVSAYQVLYESSLAYAVRKGLQAEVHRLESQHLVSTK
jgi:hypothetical protein